MNVTLSEAVEIQVKTGSRKPVGLFVVLYICFGNILTCDIIGRILLKGDCITLIQRANPVAEES